MATVSRDGGGFDPSNAKDARRFVVTGHWRHVMRSLVDCRTAGEVDFVFGLGYRTIEATLADLVDDDEEYQQAIAEIEEDTSYLEHAKEHVHRKDQDPQVVAQREKMWAKLREIQKVLVRNGIWDVEVRKRDDKSAAALREAVEP